jgi:hypothetical protein
MMPLPKPQSFQSNIYCSDNIAQSENAQSESVCFLGGDRSAAALMAILLATGGLSLSAQSAIAQTAYQTNAQTFGSVGPAVRADSGMVQVDNNAFNLQTGALHNNSNIPLPAILPTQIVEGVAQPVVPGQLAPNSIDITADVDYINQSFNDSLRQTSDNATYTLDSSSLQLTSQFDVAYAPGDHFYGEGIQVRVLGPNGEEKSNQVAFVRGDGVHFDQHGQLLPDSAQLNVTYGAQDRVELRVLNLTEDGAAPQESAIYFSQDGEFVVEDLQNGGDLDFDDGRYMQLSGGRGEALTLEERNNISVNTRIVETPLAPETRQEERVETEVVENIVESDTISTEERIWGGVETPDTVATRLGHASGVRTANNEQLVYNRYAGASEVRTGSDGLGVTGQLSPLVNNPNVPPTLLSGNLTFNPTVGDNEAGLTATVGLTQFLNTTHRPATDVFGNAIANPNPDGPRLVEPTGLFNNRRMVGYVPPTLAETVLGEELSSTNGIFTLSADQAVVIAPANPQQVGPGNAAYTNNVGGVLIESPDGAIAFWPQWTGSSYAQDRISLEAGEAQRIIYALVPQQPGQALQLGQSYAVTDSGSGYQIADGGFNIISADLQPQNFVQELAEVYAVEDTMPGLNAATSEFNGVQGVYAETFGAEPVATVDVGLAAEADARVGNSLFPVSSIAGDPGQSAYARTTVAAGFYLGGSLTGGIGNQRDTISRTDATVERATDEMRIRRTIDTFATPLVQRDAVVVQTTETVQNDGTAFFDINSRGELTNVNFLQGNSRTLSVADLEIGRTTTVSRGEEIWVSSVTEEDTIQMDSRLVVSDQETTTETDTYPNLSPVQGELALGGVVNFGNTPWTAAANTAKAEFFARDAVFGRDSGGVETGWRAEVVFHPFGEQQRDAYQYDADGNAVPVYQTEAVQDAAGNPLVETLTDESGQSVEVPVNRFVLDEAGDRIAQTVGTGRAQGPGVYLRVEDTLNDGDSAVVAGGVQFAF